MFKKQLNDLFSLSFFSLAMLMSMFVACQPPSEFASQEANMKGDHTNPNPPLKGGVMGKGADKQNNRHSRPRSSSKGGKNSDVNSTETIEKTNGKASHTPPLKGGVMKEIKSMEN